MGMSGMGGMRSPQIQKGVKSVLDWLYKTQLKTGCVCVWWGLGHKGNSVQFCKTTLLKKIHVCECTNERSGCKGRIFNQSGILNTFTVRYMFI